VDRSLLGTNLIWLFKFKIKSHLIDKSQLNYQSMVILKHWHKLPLVENQIAPANSVAAVSSPLRKAIYFPQQQKLSLPFYSMHFAAIPSLLEWLVSLQ
jgi:hypothetical protein